MIKVDIPILCINQSQHTIFKVGVRKAKPLDTLENFYWNYWNFIKFFISSPFFLWFFPFTNTSEKFQGGGSSPQAPPRHAHVQVTPNLKKSYEVKKFYCNWLVFFKEKPRGFCLESLFWRNSKLENFHKRDNPLLNLRFSQSILKL